MNPLAPQLPRVLTIVSEQKPGCWHEAMLAAQGNTILAMDFMERGSLWGPAPPAQQGWPAPLPVPEQAWRTPVARCHIHLVSCGEEHTTDDLMAG